MQNDAEVLALYDILYTLKPLRAVICNKDPSTQQYCVMQSSTVGNNSLTIPDNSAQQPISSELNQFGTNNLPFFFLGPNSPSSVLCSQCTKYVLNQSNLSLVPT